MDELVGAFAGLKGAFTSHKGFAHVKLVASILEAAVAIKDIDTFVVHLTDLWEKGRGRSAKAGFAAALH